MSLAEPGDNDRLATLDEFGSRKFVVPAEVQGRFRTWRTRVYFVLLAIFLGLPWIKINGLQAIKIDVPGRHFEIFGGLFLAHDTPLLFFILLFLVMALALATALYGRVWCGWACPQTVFIDAVYRRIEIWIEGNYIERRKLRAREMDLDKFLKVSAKWLAYIIVSSIFAHSFIAYFTGSDELIGMIQRPPHDNWTYFVIVTFVTALLTFNFGWFREQFCLIMCPYGRFQSVLMDSHSVTVLYDDRRGEPRKGLPGPNGDCVSCNRCVQICPTDIDIRRGVQMECIACTACIDACDEIMRKVKKPEGLIRYQSLRGEGMKFWRPRVLAYAFVMFFCVVGLTYGLSVREPYIVNVLRAKDTPYQLLPGDLVMNHFKVHFVNHSLGDQSFKVQVAQDLTDVVLTQPAQSHTVASGKAQETHFFLQFPRSRLSGGEVTIPIEVITGDKVERFSVRAVGP